MAQIVEHEDGTFTVHIYRTERDREVVGRFTAEGDIITAFRVDYVGKLHKLPSGWTRQWAHLKEAAARHVAARTGQGEEVKVQEAQRKELKRYLDEVSRFNEKATELMRAGRFVEATHYFREADLRKREADRIRYRELGKKVSEGGRVPVKILLMGVLVLVLVGVTILGLLLAPLFEMNVYEEEE